MNRYEAKQAARRERLQAAARAAKQESAKLSQKAHDMASVIPMGQPILVGHHSEGRDRRYRAKIGNTFSRAVAADERAEALARKAESVGTGGISSDDPDALAKLQDKLTRLEASQVLMKAVNAALRKHAQSTSEVRMAALVACGLNEAQAQVVLQPDGMARIGFADYQLRNNNAEIRRLKARLKHVAAAQSAEVKHKQFGAIEYREEDNRVWLVFPGKPADNLRSELRRYGFKWSPSRGAWVRQLTNSARWAAEQVIKKAMTDPA